MRLVNMLVNSLFVLLAYILYSRSNSISLFFLIKLFGVDWIMLGLIKNRQRMKPKNINRGRKWSIGLYTGDPLGELVELPGNPIIAAEDITDCRAGFVADPFIIEVEGIYYLFFEIMNLDSGQGGYWSYQE